MFLAQVELEDAGGWFISNQHSSAESRGCQDGHRWEKVERTLDDGFTYFYHVCKICHQTIYTGSELEKIMDYSDTHLFLSVEDWTLLLLFVNGQYIAGITHYMKMLFLAFCEFSPRHNIPSENPGFYGYKYGPYSDRIDEAIDFLIQEGYIRAEGRKSSSKERFFITEKGSRKGEIIYDKLQQEKQVDLCTFRQYWDTKTTRAICKYVYAKYPEFTDDSVILKDLFPERTLHRKRG